MLLLQVSSALGSTTTPIIPSFMIGHKTYPAKNLAKWSLILCSQCNVGAWCPYAPVINGSMAITTVCTHSELSLLSGFSLSTFESVSIKLVGWFIHSVNKYFLSVFLMPDTESLPRIYQWACKSAPRVQGAYTGTRQKTGQTITWKQLQVYSLLTVHSNQQRGRKRELAGRRGIKRKLEIKKFCLAFFVLIRHHKVNMIHKIRNLSYHLPFTIWASHHWMIECLKCMTTERKSLSSSDSSSPEEAVSKKNSLCWIY